MSFGKKQKKSSERLFPLKLCAFVKNLAKTHLLKTEETSSRKRGGQKRIRGSVLYLRFKVLDPSRLLNRLIPRLRFFFTPHFLVLSTALILLGAATVITNSRELIQDLSQLYRISSIPLFMAIIFFVVSLHEFAHGLTCKYFGGEVHEMGFPLMYFQPALLLLKPEMTGQAKISCGPRRIVELITWRTARALKVDVWSWW